MIGVNDAWDLEYDPWSHKKGMKVEDVISRTYSNIIQMINKSKTNNINLILSSILPTDMTFTSKNKERNICIMEVNNKLRNLCEKENLIYVDYYSEFVEDGQIYIKDGLTVEGLHPNTKGYNIMMRVLKESLSRNSIDL